MKRLSACIIVATLLAFGCGDPPTGADVVDDDVLLPVSILTLSLADGVADSAGSETLVASGGDSTYTWSMSAGTLYDAALTVRW